MKPRKRAETPAFGAFYELYPRKKARPDALKAWFTEGCEAIADRVMSGLRAQLPELQSRPLDKVKYPASWLRAREFEDPAIPVTPIQTKQQAVADRNIQGALDWLSGKAAG